MGGRDHSVECDVCGAMYGGFNGPDKCDHPGVTSPAPDDRVWTLHKKRGKWDDCIFGPDTESVRVVPERVAEQLRISLKAMVDATDPYMEQAAPGETLVGPWAHHFEVLSVARSSALAVLSAVRVNEMKGNDDDAA